MLPSKPKRNVTPISLRKRAVTSIEELEPEPRNPISFFASKKIEHYCFLFNDLLVITKKAGLATLMNFNVMKKKAKKKFNKNAQLTMEGTSNQATESGDHYEFERQLPLAENFLIEDSPDIYLGKFLSFFFFMLFSGLSKLS